jgi:hypothetical protein
LGHLVAALDGDFSGGVVDGPQDFDVHSLLWWGAGWFRCHVFRSSSRGVVVSTPYPLSLGGSKRGEMT